MSMSDPVGVTEIAERLAVEPRTVHKWLQRHALPAPDYPSINGHRAWEWSTILAWAGDTGRARTAEIRTEYRKAFGHEAKPERRAGPEAGSMGAQQRSAKSARTRRVKRGIMPVVPR